MLRFITKNDLRKLRKKYVQGTRVKLVSTTDPYCPIPIGTCGTVRGTDDIGNTHVSWDNGDVYGAMYLIDKLKIIGSIADKYAV